METDSQTQRTDLWLPVGWGGGKGWGVWDSQMQITVYKMENQKGPTA